MARSVVWMLNCFLESAHGLSHADRMTNSTPRCGSGTGSCSRIISLPREPNWELVATSSFVELDRRVGRSACEVIMVHCPNMHVW